MAKAKKLREGAGADLTDFNDHELYWKIDWTINDVEAAA